MLLPATRKSPSLRQVSSHRTRNHLGGARRALLVTQRAVAVTLMYLRFKHRFKLSARVKSRARSINYRSTCLRLPLPQLQHRFSALLVKRGSLKILKILLLKSMKMINQKSPRQILLKQPLWMRHNALATYHQFSCRSAASSQSKRSLTAKLKA